jgi:PAP2 superfamily.
MDDAVPLPSSKEVPVSPAFPLRGRSFVGFALVSFFCAVFLAVKYFTGGIPVFHWLFASGIVALYALHSQSRKLLFLAFPFAIYGLLYDFFRYIPMEWLQPIDVAGPYQVDLHWFGVNLHGARIHLHEFIFQALQHPVFDFLTAVCYFLHLPMALIFVLLLWIYQSEERAGRFAFAFFLMNLLALLTFALYPTAPPWYVEKFGFLQPAGPILGDAAGLVGFEKLLGLPLFSKSYQVSSVVFGAIPSMHAGVATLVWLYSFGLSRKFALVLTLYPLSICFSALYLQHHYLIDLLIGIGYALLCWALTEKLLTRPLNALNRDLRPYFRLPEAASPGLRRGGGE